MIRVAVQKSSYRIILCRLHFCRHIPTTVTEILKNKYCRYPSKTRNYNCTTKSKLSLRMSTKLALCTLKFLKYIVIDVLTSLTVVASIAMATKAVISPNVVDASSSVSTRFGRTFIHVCTHE